MGTRDGILGKYRRHASPALVGSDTASGADVADLRQHRQQLRRGFPVKVDMAQCAAGPPRHLLRILAARKTSGHVQHQTNVRAGRFQPGQGTARRRLDAQPDHAPRRIIRQQFAALRKPRQPGGISARPGEEIRLRGAKGGGVGELPFQQFEDHTPGLNGRGIQRIPLRQPAPQSGTGDEQPGIGQGLEVLQWPLDQSRDFDRAEAGRAGSEECGTEIGRRAGRRAARIITSTAPFVLLKLVASLREAVLR